MCNFTPGLVKKADRVYSEPNILEVYPPKIHSVINIGPHQLYKRQHVKKVISLCKCFKKYLFKEDMQKVFDRIQQ